MNLEFVPTETSGAALTGWTIYFSPLDFPGKYVARAWDVFSGVCEPVPRRSCSVHISLAEARAAIPPMLCLFRRHPEDDPAIIETWL